MVYISSTAEVGPDSGGIYKPGESHNTGDTLSRWPLPVAPSEVPQTDEIMLLMESLKSSPVTAEGWTSQDPILCTSCYFKAGSKRRMKNWGHNYIQWRKDELSIHEDCILWGSCVVIPQVDHSRILKELHKGHPATLWMKWLERSFIWWPQMDSDMEEKVKYCQQYQVSWHFPPFAPLHPSTTCHHDYSIEISSIWWWNCYSS